MLRGGNNSSMACTTTTTTTPGDDDDDDSNDDNVSLECADSGLGLPSDQDADQRGAPVPATTTTTRVPPSTVYQPTTSFTSTRANVPRQHALADSQPAH